MSKQVELPEKKVPSPNPLPLIGRGKLKRGSLSGKVAIVTGAGRGIGFEAARSLAWLGASVVVAELDEKTGSESAASIAEEMGNGSAQFLRVDVGDDRSVAELYRTTNDLFGKADIVLNNACLVRVGAVKDKPIEYWDEGYRVNLRGPVLLARTFLPGMVERRSGVFVCVSSSGAAPYMGAYEVFKTAQVELATTIDAELEGTGVYGFTIGPGLVRTPGALEGISQIAPLYGKTVEEFFQMSSAAIISAEAAGAGFAAAISLADRFHGQEISSMAALSAADISETSGMSLRSEASLAGSSKIDLIEAKKMCHEVLEGLSRQNADWKKYSIFMKQWMFRDFKKNAGMSIEEWLDKLKMLENKLDHGDPMPLFDSRASLEKLAGFYDHLLEQQRGFQKDPEKLKEGEEAIRSWKAPVQSLIRLIDSSP